MIDDMPIEDVIDALVVRLEREQRGTLRTDEGAWAIAYLRAARRHVADRTALRAEASR